MAQAYLTALRSASLARQVGASLCREDGSLAATGTNEVAASGGGSYWTEEPGDGRDFRGTRDTSDKMRENVLADILKRLQEAGSAPPRRRTTSRWASWSRLPCIRQTGTHLLS